MVEFHETAIAATMALLPYIPTRILSSPSADKLIYIFQPVSSSRAAQLLALNVTTTLNSNDLPYTPVSPSLPFLKDEQSTFTPVIDQHGDISAYTGACGQGSQASSLWQIREPQKSLDGKGKWQEVDLSTNEVGDARMLDGANHLASGMSFAPDVNSTAGLYIFGGMCPDSTGLTDTWTSSATYSNNMLTFQPNQPPSSPAAYKLGISPSRGPPVAEAGFSITALNPTFSSSKDGQTQSQNQNFVLIGGHTQKAFINMSQIALFSLPEQSWSFLPVNLPDVPNTDLAIRDLNNVDSRSGHTALLTSDGKKIVMFGGWVGDISQTADPQLAILELGSGYGGAGDWRWSIPNQYGSGPTKGTGVYGHGAVMLPGDVMMIVGGYIIPSSASSRRKRQTPSSNSNTYFLNVTSNSWITSYKHPLLDKPSIPQKSPSANPAAKKAGLGAGLTLGVLAIIIAVIIYFWYSRRLKRKRDRRDEDLRNLAAGAQTFGPSRQTDDLSRRSTNEMTTVGHAEGMSLPIDSGSQHYRAEPEAERTGLLFEIPSPTRGLRRSLHSRGIYQPAPRYDNGRRTPDFMSTIHPIDERDEYEEDSNHNGRSADQETIQRKDFDLLSNVPVLNPFQDPERSRSPSPQSPQAREHEIRRWVNDWTAADALMQQQGGRLSPEKTDRTSSTLSDQSARSLLSSSSWQPSAGTVSRTMSQRSAALFSVAPFRSTNDTTPMDIYRRSPEHRRSNAAKLVPGADRNIETPTSFATAKSSWPQQRHENDVFTDEESSPTKLQGRARGFMGSLKRAFVGERSASTSPEHLHSSSPSPTKASYHDHDMLQRRTSTGGSFWQARQGAKDWDAEGKQRVNADGQTAGVEEWDVESAVQNRVVQVMFTVPKDKLRVVNRAEGDGESILSTNEGSVVAEGEAGPSESKGKQIAE